MMLLVTFSFANGDNPEFETELKSLGNWSNRIPGAWILESPLGPRKVRDLLAEKMKDGDRIFVARMTRNWAGRGMGQGFPDWLGRREFGAFNEKS